MLFVGILLYFGALLIPATYLLATRCQGPTTRAMLIGVGVQLIGILAVWGFVYSCWFAGYTEYYWGWALLLPVNLVGLVYFLIVLIRHFRQVSHAESGDPCEP